MSDWRPLPALPDLRRVGGISLDTETKDGGLASDRGSGWPWGDGYICGVSAAYHGEGGAVQSHYFPLRHPDSQNFDPAQVFQWVRDHIAAGVRFVTQNGLYDWGWLRADAGIVMPPSEQLEETQAAATLVDENRHRYSLEALCKWRGLPGKDETLLREGCAALGLLPKGRKKKFNPQAHIWQLPARYVGPYAEQDPTSTLLLLESLAPVLEREGTHAAYRLEVDLLPMVHEMRRRGIRIDIAAAERARELLFRKRDAAFVELSEKLGANVGMEEIGRNKWLAETFDAYGIKYPRTEKGNPSFTAGSTGWMHKHTHWLPLLIVKADKYNNAAVNVLENYILSHVVKGRIHAEIHPHRSDEGGTRSLRFSYSDPPLQLMPSRDEELAQLIRGCFRPEEDEFWAKPDVSQQEFRFLVHYSVRHKLTKANEVAEHYRNDPNTDFHQLATTWTELDRTSAKATNFARIYGAGVRKFAAMIGKSVAEAQTIYDRYDRELPFFSQLADRCQHAVRRNGYLTLYDGARRHWNTWAPGGKWEKGAGPCSREEAEKRVRDSGHPWYGQRLYRADVRKALNALIQGSAARHTKLWMRACWREGITPLLQMHDSLDCSVSSPEQAELVAQLGRDAVQLEVPMQVDLKYGRNWGDAKHTWEELHAEMSPHVEPVEELPDAPARTQREAPKFSYDFDEAPDLPPWENDELSRPEQDFPSAHEVPPVHDVATHIWRSQDYDFPCTPTGEEQCDNDGRVYVRVRTPDGDSTFVPRDELAPAAATVESLSSSPSPSPAPPPITDSPPDSPPSPSSGNGRDPTSAPAATTTTNGQGGGHTSSTATHHSYPHSSQPKGAKVAEFIYRDLKGAPYLRVDKYVTAQGDKAFPQYRFDKGRWLKRGKNWPSIPFRLPELLAAPPGSTIDIGEGEKDALNLAKLGLIATTNPGGAGKWTPELNKWFDGFARANIYEDNDVPGHKHAAAVAAALCAVIPDVRVVKFRELPEHGDVSDWLKNGGTLAQLRTRADQAPKFIALASVNAADVEIEDYDWVWPDRFALKKIGLVVGLPDEGKGLAISDIAARITRGAAWPCNEGQAPLGSVIVLSAEDDIADTIVPRLIAANADLARITILKMMRDTVSERMFSLVTDLPVLRQKILEIGNVAMIIIDPVTAYLGVGKVDSFRATDVRAVLSPLKDLAEELRVAVLGIMHFNKKIDVTNVLLRISDSLAYGAASRHVYAIVNDPDNHRRLFVRGKNNLAHHDQKTLAFSIDAREVGTDKRTGNPIRRPYITWHDEPVDITAVEAMQAASENKSPSAREEAKEFLKELLKDGPVRATEVWAAAKENGIAKRTLERAKRELHVVDKRDGPLNEKGEITWRWHWMPKQENEDGKSHT